MHRHATRTHNLLFGKCWLVKALEAAGCRLLTVHGRILIGGEQKKRRVGPADLAAISEVVNAVKIPVLTNGNVRTFADVQHSKQATGAAGVMSAEGILANPAIFESEIADAEAGDGTTATPASILALAMEYFDLCEKQLGPPPPPVDCMRRHLIWMLGKEGHGRCIHFQLLRESHPVYPRHTDLLHALRGAGSIADLRAVAAAALS
jgi:tRNA-dihydrouridine synthase